jgi:hypothetical protein
MTNIALFFLLSGKTNHGVRLYGRVVRHKNVELCGIGALGFYLMFRFHHSGEFDPPPDFTDNKAWFDIKLMTGGSKHNTHTMTNDTYGKAIRKVLKQVKIASNHYAHLGRVMGPAQLEFLEFDQRDIQTLGNWDPSMQESRYSTKLPMKVMRGIAGFTENGGMYYNPRTVVEPPEELKYMIFPFADQSLKEVEEAKARDGKERYTAVYFLRLLIRLRTVILQDAAAMLIKERHRCSHLLFKLPVFASPLFEVSVVVLLVYCCVLCLLATVSANIFLFGVPDICTDHAL